MKTNSLLIRRLPIVICLFTLLLFNNSCKKVDEIIDAALDFDGIFKNSTGWEVDLYQMGTDKIGHAQYSKAGTAVTGFSTGTSFAYDMVRVDDDTWTGMVRSNNGFSSAFSNGDISISGDNLTIDPDNGSAYTLIRVGTSGTGTGGGTGTSTTTLLYDQLVSGNEGDKKTFYFTLPAGVTKMEIKTTESASAYRNTADLFVKKSIAATITKTPTYSSNADCEGLRPNREDEVCVFNNPSGTWYVTLFGYNTYFSSQLKVTITR